MRKANKFIYAGLFMLCTSAHTQTPPTTTLSQAIEIVKARKALELSSTTQAYISPQRAESTSISNKTNTSNNAIELWAIRGLGHDLRAEVIYQGQIKEVSFAYEKIRIGNWLLIGINDQEVEFSALQKNGKLSSKKIRLTLPQRSNMASMWPSSYLEGMSSADGTSRPPVPMSMLKP